MSRILQVLVFMSFMAVLTACAGNTPTESDHINDPFEATNRQVHAFNKELDKALLGPLSRIYGAIVPYEFQYFLGNAVDNLGQPRTFVNYVLQGDGDAAGNTFLRFLLNSTIGMAGILDPAAEMGIFDDPTDFGETLAVWGVAEGPYIELPLVGASTLRDAVGMLVDFGINPVDYALTDEQAYYLLMARAIDLIGTRHEYNDLIQILLYESADSYAAQRISYLQNRRHSVAGETTIDDLEDPYAYE